MTDIDDQSMYRQVEDAFFGILWTLQTKRKNELVNINLLSCLGGMVLDFCHMLAFFVHSFGWGDITITWGTYVRYVQLQLPLYHYEGFAYAFWAAVAIAALIALNAVVVGYSFWTKNFNQLWAIKLLHFIVAVFFNFVFIASFYLLSTPWWCDPELNVLIPFHENGQDIGCFTWPNILAVVLGTIAIIFLVFLVFTSSLASSEFEPVVNDLDAICSPSYRICYNCCLIFMTVDEYYIAKVIPVVGHWWEALFNLILVTLCFAVIIYYLPFQMQLGNELRGGMLGLLWWAAACSFVLINMEENPKHVNRVMDYVLLAGMIPFAILGSLLVTQRYYVLRAFAAGLVDQIDPNFVPEEQNKARFGTRKQDFIEGSDRNPDVYMPNSLQIFSTNLTTIEIIGRMLWFEKDDKRSFEAAYKFYRLADWAYPDVAYVKLLRATCLLALADDPSLVKGQYDMVKTMNPSFSVRFQIYKREMEAKQKGSSNSTAPKEGDEKAGEEALDLVAYVEFQKYYLEAQRYNAAAVDAIREFWALFLQPEVTFRAFNVAACAIEAETAKALATYKTLLIRYPKHVAILSSYAYFLDLVMHNADEAARYHKKSEEIRSREAEASNKMTIDGRSSDAAVISITEDGTIDAVNKTLCQMFGYTKSELVGRNIKSIVPSPWKGKHDLFLDRYITTGDAKVIGKAPRALFGQHKAGYAFALNLSIQERRKERGEKTFVALLVQTDLEKKEGVVIIKEDGTIILVSKVVTELFGYTPAEMLGTNVTIFMLDAYAANHESYLRRYKETGEARVIGTAGRNVPARKKDATVFPASLTVVEEYVGFEKFFLANIQDTTNLKATIYIDGMGTIQNVDIGITQLLGYRKDDVVGKNIKGIMPPPYNQYHEMYLERYRRTKVSNILRSVDGRVLPAVHADGSIVSILAIVTRADGGDSSGMSGNMLFKGVVQRVDAVGKKEIRAGFRDQDVLEIDKTGIIKYISPSVLPFLNYPKEMSADSFAGKPVEFLIPKIENRPTQDKGYWIPKCLAAGDLNFYILLMNKNLSLTPFTMSLQMKSADTILIRLKDISNLDALITIDDLGVILAFNEDAFLLLGHDPDEALGQNIKFMLAPEISVQHDFFLQRYKDTRVARVVGVARTLNTIHRDKSVLPIEIQVTELNNGGVVTFIGRIRHTVIEDRISQDAVDELMNHVGNIDKTMKRVLSQKEIEEDENKDKFSDHISNDSSYQKMNRFEEEYEEDDKDESRDELEDIDHKGIDSKLRYIKESDAQDRNSMALKKALDYSMVFFGLILIAALIVFNVLPKPTNYLTMMQQFMLNTKAIADVVAAARQLQLQQYAAALGTSYPCTWSSSVSNPPVCAWVNNNNASADLIAIDASLSTISSWFTNNYASLKTSGDAIDAVYSASHYYYDFTSANPNTPILSTAASWQELTNSKLRPYVATLMTTNTISSSKQAWNFIIYNRFLLDAYSLELMNTIPSKVQSMMAQELIIHLIFTLILIFVGLLIFFFVIGPRIRNIVADRMLILKLVLLVPRPIIMDFVNVMYRAGSNENDDDEEDEAATMAGVKSRQAANTKVRSDDISEIIPDKNNKTLITFILGLFAISVPSIIHCGWRLSNNNVIQNSMTDYLSTVKLYTGIYSLRWRETDIWAASCGDIFCNDFSTSMSNVSSAIQTNYNNYYTVQNSFAGSDSFTNILYRISQFDPYIGTNFCPSAITKPETAGTRCNDSYTGSDLPPDFSLGATRGISNYIKNILSFGWRITQSKTPSVIPTNEFFFTWESIPLEGNALLKELVSMQEGIVSDLYSASKTAATATYGVTLAFMLILFLWKFGSIRKNLQNEARHNRSILFMIPLDIVKKNKQILDYVDRVFIDLSS